MTVGVVNLITEALRPDYFVPVKITPIENSAERIEWIRTLVRDALSQCEERQQIVAHDPLSEYRVKLQRVWQWNAVHNGGRLGLAVLKAVKEFDHLLEARGDYARVDRVDADS